MKMTVSDVSVDAGIIMVGDVSCLKRFPNSKDPQKNHLAQVFDISNGEYRVSWSIENSWVGKIEGVKKIKVTSGKVFVSDPCYLISDSCWAKWVDNYNDGIIFEEENAFIIDGMGGDGSYEVEFIFML